MMWDEGDAETSDAMISTLITLGVETPDAVKYVKSLYGKTITFLWRRTEEEDSLS